MRLTSYVVGILIVAGVAVRGHSLALEGLPDIEQVIGAGLIVLAIRVYTDLFRERD